MQRRWNHRKSSYSRCNGVNVHFTSVLFTAKLGHDALLCDASVMSPVSCQEVASSLSVESRQKMPASISPLLTCFCLFHCLMVREICTGVISGHVRGLGQSVTKTYWINIGAVEPDAFKPQEEHYLDIAVHHYPLPPRT